MHKPLPNPMVNNYACQVASITCTLSAQLVNVFQPLHILCTAVCMTTVHAFNADNKSL